tara:strand:+ start:894 stop:1391 length:498 start_codon:yes stop_codon:yes gene_type:complete
MTYSPNIRTGKMSVFVLGNVHNQYSTSNQTYSDYQITSTVTEEVNQFSISLSIADNRVTLPAGSYYLEARLYVYTANTNTWGAEYGWYSWNGSTRTAIGYTGREQGAVAMSDPHKHEHAAAYIESDGSAVIGLQFKSTTTVSQLVSATNYVSYAGQSRLMIWRIA